MAYHISLYFLNFKYNLYCNNYLLFIFENNFLIEKSRIFWPTALREDGFIHFQEYFWVNQYKEHECYSNSFLRLLFQ